MSSPALRLCVLAVALELVASAGADDEKKVELNVGDPAPAIEARTD